MLILKILLLSLSLPAAIYGPDDRRDILHVPQYRPQAAAVAVAVSHVFLQKNPDGSFRIDDVVDLARAAEVAACPNERFAQQPVVGVCTGFLVGDRYLLTAGHCMIPTGVVDDENHPFCESFSWYFDYNLKSPNRPLDQAIPADRVYGCKRVIRAENIAQGRDDQTGNDFAVIELDRPVRGIQPLPLASSAVEVGDGVFAIGHPSGLPAKFSGISKVLRSEPRPFFEVNLDALGGNSGSPVFNLRKEVVGILVSGIEADYWRDPGGCYRVNRCDANGENCDEPAVLQKSNFIQRIETVFPFLPR